MCHLEHYVYNNYARKQDPQHYVPRQIAKNILGYRFRDKLENEPGWVPCPKATNATGH